MSTKKTDPNRDQESQRYDNPIASREFILEILSDIAGFVSFEALLELCSIETSQYEAFTRRLKAMVRDQQLLTNGRQQYLALDPKKPLIGEVQALDHKHYQVFLKDYGVRMKLGHQHSLGVFPGDIVQVAPSGFAGQSELFCVICEVIEHHTHQLIGRMHQERHVSYVVPENRHIIQVILVPPNLTGSAHAGDYVEVDLQVQPTTKTQAIGQVTQVLGDLSDLDTTLEVAMKTFNLPHQWPQAIEQLDFPTEVTDADLKGRQDLCQLPFVTIDGEDAKDFDDAICCQPHPSGGWTLWVAIADVSHYVQHGSVLDQEAQKRGNSVYFPKKVIPMLPEALSNELCSLKPEVKRLTLCCQMQLNATGQVIQSEFYKAVIYSHQRLTYDQVTDFLEQSNKTVPKSEVQQSILAVNQLFEVLLGHRFERGAIEIDVPELQFQFDHKNQVTHAITRPRLVAHRIIEECMLLANVCAAKFLLKHKTLSLYRIHDRPKADKLEALFKYASLLGYQNDRLEPNITGITYNALLSAFQGRPEWMVMQILVLRTMKQAQYAPDNIGHYGLAYEAYTHFTSPIRRYADLLVHRAIKATLNPKDDSGCILPYGQLADLGEHLTDCEKKADEASRDVADGLKCTMMEARVGEHFEVVITSCHAFGMFVEIPQNRVDGLVHVSTMLDDYYHYDEAQLCLRGELSGKCYRLGEKHVAQLVRADALERKIDFMFVEQGPALGAKARKHAKKNNKTSTGGRGQRRAKDGKSAQKGGSVQATKSPKKSKAKFKSKGKKSSVRSKSKK